MSKVPLRVILVHGSCHGAWCWYKVVAGLRSKGYHSVMAIDLAASGTDWRKIPEDVSTFQDYNRPLMELLASVPDGEKVILVGHSFGGFSLAFAMDAFPEKIAAGVFLNAFLPDTVHEPSYFIDQQNQRLSSRNIKIEMKPVMVSGRSEPLITMCFDSKILAENLYQLSSFEQIQRLSSRNIKIEMKHVMVPGRSEPLVTACFDSKILADYLYQLSSFEDLTLASMMTRPTAIFQELSENPPFTKEGFGLVDKIYIACEEDELIKEEYQRWMIQNNGAVKETMEIKGADHMPMFSKPHELCQCLASIANKYSSI